jgi:hypothetical protein
MIDPQVAGSPAADADEANCRRAADSPFDDSYLSYLYCL